MKGETSMRKMKSCPQWGKGVLAVAALVGLLAGSIHFASARVIPGVDRPYDPAAYYSPTAISYADSKPSVFALRDIARQGGTVYDPIREAKEILIAERFASLLDIVEQKLGIELRNHQPMAEELIERASTTGVVKRSNAEKMLGDVTTTQDAIEQSPFFHRYEESSTVYETPRDKKKQRQMIADASATYAAVAQQALSDRAATDETLRLLLQAAANAQGTQELLQIQTQVDALAAANRAQMAGLSNACNAIRHLRHKQELDDAVEFEKTVERSRIIIADPFDMEASVATGFQRPAARGFVSF